MQRRYFRTRVRLHAGGILYLDSLQTGRRTRVLHFRVSNLLRLPQAVIDLKLGHSTFLQCSTVADLRSNLNAEDGRQLASGEDIEVIVVRSGTGLSEYSCREELHVRQVSVAFP